MGSLVERWRNTVHRSKIVEYGLTNHGCPPDSSMIGSVAFRSSWALPKTLLDQKRKSRLWCGICLIALLGLYHTCLDVLFQRYWTLPTVGRSEYLGVYTTTDLPILCGTNMRLSNVNACRNFYALCPDSLCTADPPLARIMHVSVHAHAR